MGKKSIAYPTNGCNRNDDGNDDEGKKNANEKQSGENSLILGLLFENPPTATFLDLSTMPTSYIIHWGRSIEEKGTPR